MTANFRCCHHNRSAQLPLQSVRNRFQIRGGTAGGKKPKRCLGCPFGSAILWSPRLGANWARTAEPAYQSGPFSRPSAAETLKGLQFQLSLRDSNSKFRVAGETEVGLGTLGERSDSGRGLFLPRNGDSSSDSPKRLTQILEESAEVRGVGPGKRSAAHAAGKPQGGAGRRWGQGRVPGGGWGRRGLPGVPAKPCTEEVAVVALACGPRAACTRTLRHGGAPGASEWTAPALFHASSPDQPLTAQAQRRCAAGAARVSAATGTAGDCFPRPPRGKCELRVCERGEGEGA